MTTPLPSIHTGEIVRDLMRSELIKIRSARTLRLLPVLALIIPPLLAAVVGSTGSLEPEDTVLGAALTGTSMALAVVGAWSALIVTTEFGSGTIRPVLAASPRRDLVLAAKALVVVLVSIPLGLVATTAAYLVGRAVIESPEYAAGQVFPGILGIVCCFPAVALSGVAFGVLLRNSAGAVAVVGGYLIVPQISAAQAFGDLHKWLTVGAPSAVVAKLSQSSDAAPQIMGTLGGWPRLAVVVAGALGALSMARRVFDRIDL
ncbi:ABC transporter permease [Nocardia sp. 2]|uniref:ABC transporter permease n=1 Tax=Nocardia acididurans TaxID=2802282 RepID=A0ABS1M7A2_9NOCA|nr:ABC transporter permease [Nocardia acididurans]MBL1076456.1 ABC transporter permease [Nocardia acididurans]